MIIYIFKTIAYPSTKALASWVTNLRKRTQFFSFWQKIVISYAEGNSIDVNPAFFWISGFIFPQGK